MKPMKRVYVLVEVEVEKDIKDLTDKVAGRVYTLDSVWNTTAWLIDGMSSTCMNLVKAVVEASEWEERLRKALESDSEELSDEVDTKVASRV